MTTAQRLIGVLCVIIFAAGLSAGRSPDSVGLWGDLLSCSPAPCVLPPTQVSFAGHGASDEVMASDPANPGHIALGTDGSCSSDSVLSFYVTSDGGSNWNDACMVPLLSGGQEYIPDFAPILAYDRNGVAYIGGFYLDDNGRTSFGFEGFEKSSDGVTWSSPAPAVIRRNYTPDWCWMAADTSEGSPFVNSVYVACVLVALKAPFNEQMVVAHSRDGGQTWQQVGVAAPQPQDADFYPAMTVGGDGSVYLTWQYCNPNDGCNNNRGYMVFSKSSDGGNTWSKPTLVSTVSLHGIPNTFIGVPNTPAIAVDNSGGPHAGTLYVTMYNWTGSFMQVQVARSTDGGKTWSKPVPVAPGITHDQFLPWISVSPNGLVGVSWLDRRNDPANIDYQAFAGISSNGGISFENVQLTTAFSNPNTGAINFSIGNYTGNTWDGPNYFLAAWMDDSQTMYMQDFVGGIRLK